MQTSVLFHYIHIINCLPIEDAGGSRRTREALDDLCVAEKTATVKYNQTTSASEFQAILKNISTDTNLHHIPLIHVEAHADKEKGLEFQRDEEAPTYLSWSIIADLLREINVKTQNRLFVVFCACSAFFILGEVHPSKQAPFSVCVSPYSSLTLHEIENTIPTFYRELMIRYNFVDAIAATRDAFQYTSSELFLKDILVKMVRSTIGKKGRERRENMLTEVVAQSTQPLNLKKARAEIKENWTLTDKHINQFALQYLGGREFPYTAAQIIDEARKEHQNHL